MTHLPNINVDVEERQRHKYQTNARTQRMRKTHVPYICMNVENEKDTSNKQKHGCRRKRKAQVPNKSLLTNEQIIQGVLLLG